MDYHNINIIMLWGPGKSWNFFKQQRELWTPTRFSVTQTHTDTRAVIIQVEDFQTTCALHLIALHCSAESTQHHLQYIDRRLTASFPGHLGDPASEKYKNSSGDERATVNFYAVRPEATRIRWNNTITPFKVIQGHQFSYQSKAHIQFPISD